MQLKTLTLAAALALGTTASSFAYPPSNDQPDVGLANTDQATQVGDSAWFVDRLNDLLKPADEDKAKDRPLIPRRRSRTEG